MASTWKCGGLIWRGTWGRAEAEYRGVPLMIRFSGCDWCATVSGERIGRAASRGAAMRLAKSRVPTAAGCAGGEDK
jgi:hypothetical protein